MNTRKLVALSLALALFFSIAGCSKSSSGGAPDGNEKKEYRIAMVTNDSINDGGWNTACYGGMCDAAAEYGFTTAYTEKVAEADYVTAFTEYANMGFDLIFAVGNEYTSAVVEVAPNFPKSNFIILNGDVMGENYASIKCDNVQMGFIAGVIAGLKTKTNSIGYVGATEITTSLDNINGFEQGAAYVNPDAKVSVVWANSWTDTAKGKELAISMITTNDTDVFYGNAGTIDLGVREAASEYKDRYVVAQPGEALEQAPDVILTSVITDNKALLGMAMAAVLDGTFGNTIYKGGLAEGVLSVGKFGAAAKDQEAQFMEIYEKLKAGEIELKATEN